MAVCPPDHLHAHALTCATRHSCRCDECVANRREYDRSRRQITGGGVLIPAAPSTRRLRALARHGWTSPHISSLTGIDTNVLNELRLGNNANVRQPRARQIAAFYAKHALEVINTMQGRRAVGLALRQGWHSPLEWEDIELGILD